MITDGVLELPGLYGPFTFPEKLLQKIWLRREFETGRAVTTDGRQVTLIHQGKWNLLGGPDFKNARLRIGEGPEISGDIELHLHAEDWSAHRHARDPAYDGVILHVVLFPPAENHLTLGAGEIKLPVLVLLPLLHHDLEEYAADDAVEHLANRPAAQIVEALGSLSLADVRSLLMQKAELRWSQKVRFAGVRIDRLGWEEACHQTAMEILGYRFNRAAMLRVSARFPLDRWTENALDLAEVFKAGEEWSLQGLRPANHPRVRLRQYHQWVSERADWPSRLRKLGSQLPAVEASLMAETAKARREGGFSGLRRSWNEEITDGVIGGTRFENLMCDGFLPLLAAHGIGQPHGVWHHWFAGDVPLLWRIALRQLDVFSQGVHPACHGLIQGLLGWLIERERTALVSRGRSA